MCQWDITGKKNMKKFGILFFVLLSVTISSCKKDLNSSNNKVSVVTYEALDEDRYYLYTGGMATVMTGTPKISSKGICYSKNNHTPNIDDERIHCGTGEGEFDAAIPLSTGGYRYYYRAYAIYDDNIVVYGETFMEIATGTGYY